MQFYEKLKFLLTLTQTTNRQLAQEIQVDPSLISRLRTGARGVPRNREHIKAMARFFAKRCITDYQRQALSEVLGIRQTLTVQKEPLAEILYYWLCGETDEVNRFMRTFETLAIEEASPGPAMESYNLNGVNSIYYGNEGKRAAARALFQHLHTLAPPCEVFIFADESDDWISEDYKFSRDLQRWGLELLQRGFHFYHIAPPTTSVIQAFESLARWLPLYMTGRADAYYYPRMRDVVHRRTMVVVPGEIAMTSNSVASRHSACAAILTTDPRLTQAYTEEFQDYLFLCRPMLDACTHPEKLTQRFTRFLSADGMRIQKLATLSAETAPRELLDYCIGQIPSADLPKLGNLYLQEMELRERKDDPYELIDIGWLASAREVRAGLVPIVFSYGNEGKQFHYTPELYVLHLKNILRLLENCENYHFIPLSPQTVREGAIMVKKGQKALLLRTAPPLAVFEISQPDMVQLCAEHLLRIADRVGYTGIHRAKIMSQIKERIRELEV